MDGGDIRNVLRRDLKTRHSFAGVFPRNGALTRRSGLFVFNTHWEHQPGEHWIAVSALPNRDVEYFDSYGFPPHIYPGVHAALREHGRQLQWNSTALQGLFSTVCGDYCVLFLLLSARGWTLADFVTRMAEVPDPESRDHAVRSLVKRLYGELVTYEPGDGADAVHILGSGLL